MNAPIMAAKTAIQTVALARSGLATARSGAAARGAEPVRVRSDMASPGIDLFDASCDASVRRWARADCGAAAAPTCLV